MATDTPSQDPLAQLSGAGVSVWLDDLSRERLRTGNLGDLIRDRHVVGITTNPTIFQKAISGADAYAPQLDDLATRGVDVGEALRLITTSDVRWGCDVLLPVYEASDTVDGRVSIEVDPRISGDAAKTIAEARSLWWMVDRPNLYIKIPATRGQPAGDRTGPGRGHQRQRHADLLPRALRPGHRRLLRRPRAGTGGRARPQRHRLGRVVLRLPRRHRDRQAPRQDRHPRGEGDQGQGGRRQRPAGLPAVRGEVRRRALGLPGRVGRQGAAAAVGLHRRQGPRLRRHHVRRRPGRRPTPSTRCPSRRCRPYTTMA